MPPVDAPNDNGTTIIGGLAAGDRGAGVGVGVGDRFLVFDGTPVDSSKDLVRDTLRGLVKGVGFFGLPRGEVGATPIDAPDEKCTTTVGELA